MFAVSAVAVNLVSCVGFQAGWRTEWLCVGLHNNQWPKLSNVKHPAFCRLCCKHNVLVKKINLQSPCTVPFTLKKAALACVFFVFQGICDWDTLRRGLPSLGRSSVGSFLKWRKKVRAYLHVSSSKVCITTDYWRSPNWIPFHKQAACFWALFHCRW